MMRRDLLLGAGCVAALAGAEALRPRKLMSLSGKAKLTDIIPTRFDGWQAEGEGDIVTPKTPGSLASTLYNDTVARNYRHPAVPGPVMLLAAHGDSQSDLLQLHRPESCYQAVGFQITGHALSPVPLGRDASLPAVALVARTVGRTEDVLYWTRLGEYLPISAGEQRRDRLKTAMSGYIADGVLVRVSMIREETAAAADPVLLRTFVTALVHAVRPAARPALIGTRLADALAGRSA